VRGDDFKRVWLKEAAPGRCWLEHVNQRELVQLSAFMGQP
jgi:hypothetical protein